MTASDVPQFYDDLQLSLAELRLIVEDGVKNRRSASHHPVVASVEASGMPHQRVMILRDIDWDRREIRFHTDSRSDKIGQYEGRTQSSILIYDEQAKVQIRMSGSAHVGDREITDVAWSGSTPFARRCYMAETSPGSIAPAPTSGLPSWIEGKQPDEEQLAPARPNFAVLLINFDTVEWLYLANSGHRRARWQWDPTIQDWSGDWLIP